MEYLVPSNRAVAGENPAKHIDVAGKNVIILGGGDTGADCLGTALRQGAASVTTLAIGKQPPLERPASKPWPMTPNLFEVQSAREEGGERSYLASTVEFVGNETGELTGLVVAETEFVDGGRRPKMGSEKMLVADVVLLALGYSGIESRTMEEQIQIELSDSGTVSRTRAYERTSPVFLSLEMLVAELR